MRGRSRVLNAAAPAMDADLFASGYNVLSGDTNTGFLFDSGALAAVSGSAKPYPVTRVRALPGRY